MSDMQSPLHPEVSLEPATIEPGFLVMRCPKSGGIWIRPGAYWHWREERVALSDDGDGNDVPGTDSEAGKRCPEDGYFLIRHRVGHGLPFHVDRCGHCGGIWLDAGEWGALKGKQFHDHLHLIFTSTWQARVRQQQARAAHEAFLLSRLGDEDVAKLEEIAQWLATHPQRHIMLAHLAHQLGETEPAKA